MSHGGQWRNALWRCVECWALLSKPRAVLCMDCYGEVQRRHSRRGAPTRMHLLVWLLEEHWIRLERNGALARWQTKVLAEYGTIRAIAA